MKRTIVAALVSCVTATPALSVEDINKDYIKSLAAPGKTVLVVEYYDGGGKVVDRKGYTSATGYNAVSPTDFKVDEKTTLHLYGVQPCQGDMVNRNEGYSGSCDEFAERELQVMLKSAKVLFCRAFVSEQNSPTQNATCYGYYNYPGSLDSVDMLENELVSLGALRVSKKPDGSPERSDLDEAQRIGKQGYGMWADPRVKGQ
ncbi:MAG: hypothetical protein E5W94_30840 [Mesorhizobium sp.]|uniref:hypothetical protein n=1 Tax=Mesorhizobium sp. TaxID=1871066 RepID=UPI000FE883FD|nr:hypothetical protein [Mesorhizobium sp.]RWE64105.1 MAG: hypothetical protein EOS62_30870 [Mesorhizobium sp.]TIS72461.1 MAG: hypothetical protein E5W94_30840 [Mesorhizobium sp.]